MSSKIFGSPAMSKGKISLVIMVFYAASNVFVPKIDLGFATIYFFELIWLGFLCCYCASGRISVSTSVEKTYLFFCLLSLLTFVQGIFYSGVFEFSPVLLVLKYTMYIFIFPIVRYLGPLVSTKLILQVIKSQFIFVLGVSVFIAFNMIVNPISLGDMIWNYSPLYRLIGLTGQAVGENGLVSVGNTSVQMGVYTAFLFLIAISLFIQLREKKYVFWSAVMFIGCLLTYSRSGLLVIFIGLIFLTFRKFKSINFLILVSFTTFTFLLLSLFFDLSAFFISFGSIGKLIETSFVMDGSAQIRIKYVLSAFRYIAEHPFGLFFGTGYGEVFTYNLIGTPHLESLIFTTLFQSGIFAVLVLIFHFYFLSASVNVRTSLTGSKDLHTVNAILFGVWLYIPGLFIANLVGGNSLQTDFIAPLFYFIVAACLNIRSNGIINAS